MGHTVEAGTERHHLRRKNQLNANRGSTVKRTLPQPVRRQAPTFPDAARARLGAVKAELFDVEEEQVDVMPTSA
jgi:hypothetical protein